MISRRKSQGYLRRSCRKILPWTGLMLNHFSFSRYLQKTKILFISVCLELDLFCPNYHRIENISTEGQQLSTTGSLNLEVISAFALSQKVSDLEFLYLYTESCTVLTIILHWFSPTRFNPSTTPTSTHSYSSRLPIWLEIQSWISWWHRICCALHQKRCFGMGRSAGTRGWRVVASPKKRHSHLQCHIQNMDYYSSTRTDSDFLSIQCECRWWQSHLHFWWEKLPILSCFISDNQRAFHSQLRGRLWKGWNWRRVALTEISPCRVDVQKQHLLRIWIQSRGRRDGFHSRRRLQNDNPPQRRSHQPNCQIWFGEKNVFQFSNSWISTNATQGFRRCEARVQGLHLWWHFQWIRMFARLCFRHGNKSVVRVAKPWSQTRRKRTVIDGSSASSDLFVRWRPTRNSNIWQSDDFQR